MSLIRVANGRRARRGFTMIELLIAAAIMSVLVLGLAAMADAVHRGNEHSTGYGLAVQHARVVLERIARHVERATASEEFPGVLVVSETVDSYTFPDTLVVWSPDGAASAPDGAPRVGELVIYTTNPTQPNELWELTDRDSTSAAPAVTDASAWRSLVSMLRTSNTSEKVLLTDLVRVAQVRSSDVSTRRPAIRFAHRLTPSQTQWSEYRGGTRSWENLDWAQGIGGASTGLRQSWVRYELQLEPGEPPSANNAGAMPAYPFFGSAALYYPLQK